MPEIETLDAIAPLETDWDRLAVDLAMPPFVRPGWVSAWWEAFGSGALQLLAARRGGRLVGVLPVVRRYGEARSPTNWHSHVFGAVAEDEAVMQGLYEAALAARPRRLDVSFLDAEAPDAEALARAAGEYRLLTRRKVSSPYVPVDRDWDSYWSSRSRNLRGTVRRCRNRLADMGEVSVEIADGRRDLDSLLAEGLRLEASGWKGEKGTAIVSRPDTRDFYEAVCRWAAAKQVLSLAFLRVDGRAVAFELSLETGGRRYLLKPGHDAELDSFGPGTVLLAAMVERTFSLGLAAYEFLGAAERYKLRWADRCHDMIRVQAFRPTLPGMVERVVQTQIARRRGKS